MLLLATRVVDIDGLTYLETDRDYPRVFATGSEQLVRLYQHLYGLGYIGNAAEPHPGATGIQLTLSGWQRIEELRRLHPSSSDQAFVAMWFADEMNEAFHKGMFPGLDATGYTPFRVGLRPHNDKIDDRIVAEIRRSGLVVADFTGHRGGAYWEAGFAQGLGIPVIRTCRKDYFGDIHFDTRQYLHLVWETPDELRKRLQEHIRATIPGRATAQRRGKG
jgi:nucleoside 2-deoxyribosyltransferase